MKRISVALVAVCTLSLAGCAGTQSPGAGGPGSGGAAGTGGSGGSATAMPGAPPLDAAMVTREFGWVLTADRLLVSRDGGTTFAPMDVPVPAGETRAAYFADPTTGVVAAADGESVKVSVTRNGGQTWRTSTIREPAATPAGYSSLSVSFAGPGYGAVLARAATSQAFSIGTVIATADGGASWTARPAPEAGVVRVEPDGRIWLAGASLNSTTDQGRTWTRSELALAGQAEAATLTPPVAGTLPVTTIHGGRTEVQLLTSTDGGRTWGQPARLPTHGRTGAGVRLAVASTPAGPLVFDNIGGHAYRRDGTDLRPRGLPDGVLTVTFAMDGRAGWALAGYGTCANGKQDCTYRHDLLTTADGGSNWTTLATWTRPV